MPNTQRQPHQMRLLAPTIQDSFDEFHREHPEVYRLLVRFAREAKAAGQEHYGIKALYERIRWHYHVERKEGAPKLNNNLTSRYARLIEEQEPDLRGFFELRRLRA